MVALFFANWWGAFTPWYDIEVTVTDRVVIDWDKCVVTGKMPDGKIITGISDDQWNVCTYKIGNVVTAHTNGYWINLYP